eukprot:scaffold1341_cov178-Amphora_coffeaeformis.AAC.28
MARTGSKFCAGQQILTPHSCGSGSGGNFHIDQKALHASSPSAPTVKFSTLEVLPICEWAPNYGKRGI